MRRHDGYTILAQALMHEQHMFNGSYSIFCFPFFFSAVSHVLASAAPRRSLLSCALLFRPFFSIFLSLSSPFCVSTFPPIPCLPCPFASLLLRYYLSCGFLVASTPIIHISSSNATFSPSTYSVMLLFYSYLSRLPTCSSQTHYLFTSIYLSIYPSIDLHTFTYLSVFSLKPLHRNSKAQAKHRQHHTWLSAQAWSTQPAPLHNDSLSNNGCSFSMCY